MPRLYGDTVLRGLDANGNPVSGARLYVFQAGTTTPVTTYSDEALTTAQAVPVLADSAGVFPAVYVRGGEYKIALRTPADVELPGSPADNIATVSDTSFATAAALQALSFTGTRPATVSLRGYYAEGDGGSGEWKSVPSEPSHALKLQSADGGWWEYVPVVGSVVPLISVGAKTDNSASISALWNGATTLLSSRGGGEVLLPRGTMQLTATITGADGVSVRGYGQRATILTRTGSYGHTYTQTGGRVDLRDFAMVHGTQYVTGDASLDNRLTDGSGHIRLLDVQYGEIKNIRAWRMPYSVILDGAHIVTVEGCWFRGVNDPTVTDLQEGAADIIFLHTNRFCQLITLRGNYFSGTPGPERNITYTDSALNAVTVSRVANIGRTHCLLINACEGLEVDGGYFGRAASSLVRYTLDDAATLTFNHVYQGAFFDNAGNAAGEDSQIDVFVSASGAYLAKLTVSGCVFNGQYDTMHAINLRRSAGATFSAYGVSISGCTFLAHVATPIRCDGVKGFSITGNTISGYNGWGVSPTGADASFSAGILVTALATAGSITGNTIGGSGNIFGTADHQHYGIFFLNTSANVSRAGNCNAGVTTQFDNHA